MKTKKIKKLYDEGMTMTRMTINALIDAQEALEKSISVKAIEDLNNRVFALERKYNQHIKAEHIGYDPHTKQEFCECNSPNLIPSHEGICDWCHKPLPKQEDNTGELYTDNVR